MSAVVSVRTPGGVADRDPARGAGGEIDVVDPDRHLGDDAQLRSGGVQQVGVDAVGDQADDAVNARDLCQQRFARGRRVVGPDVQSEALVAQQ